MPSQYVKILITGLPGCGKTTAVMKILENLNCNKVAGFYTQEIRKADKRKGFRWTRLDGKTGILSHTDFKGPFKVGKYGVDIAGFEENVVPILDIERPDVELFILDEIGKMECLSESFIESVHRLFTSEKSVLATISQKGAGFIREVKNYPGTKLFKLTTRNRDKTIAGILQILSFLKRPPK